MNLLVTGAAGFIGSHYVRRVLQGAYPAFANARVVALDAVTYAGNIENLSPVADDARLHFVRGDVRDQEVVEKVVRDIDVVVHFAAESHVDRSVEGADDFVSTNVLGTQRLLEAAHGAGVSRFVHISTDEVYGSIESGHWTEEQALDPNSPYSASKASSDLLSRAFYRTRGLPVCVTRCSNNYGPYQHPEKVIPRFITNLLSGGTVPLYGDGGNMRDWLHVDDHCSGIQLVAERGAPGEVYNIGGGTELTNVELIDKILELLGKDWSQVVRVADRPGHDRRYSVDCAKIRTELGYAPRVPFGQGLLETVRWYRDNSSWWQSTRSVTAGRR